MTTDSVSLTPARLAEIEVLRGAVTGKIHPLTTHGWLWLTTDEVAFFKAAPTILDELLAALQECEEHLTQRQWIHEHWLAENAKLDAALKAAEARCAELEHHQSEEKRLRRRRYLHALRLEPGETEAGLTALDERRDDGSEREDVERGRVPRRAHPRGGDQDRGMNAAERGVLSTDEGIWIDGVQVAGPTRANG